MTTASTLISELERWARDRQVLPQEFKCPHYDCCQESRLCRSYPLLDGGKTCQMSYVGREYGSAVSGKAFRLVIVGMDHADSNSGETNGKDFVECQSAIEDCYYGSDTNKFNPHYAGVIRTAAAILGQTGQYCMENCWKKRKCAGDKRPSDTRCVLRSFAQSNLVKCVNAPNRNCLATPEMYRRCSGHLVQELEVLKPDVVVFHGVDARYYFATAVQDAGQKLERCPEGPADQHGPVIWELAAKSQCFVLFLLHPSRGWLDRQWSVVEQALEWLRLRRVIPV
jgi:hypothetical protein